MSFIDLIAIYRRRRNYSANPTGHGGIIDSQSDYNIAIEKPDITHGVFNPERSQLQAIYRPKSFTNVPVHGARHTGQGRFSLCISVAHPTQIWWPHMYTQSAGSMHTGHSLASTSAFCCLRNSSISPALSCIARAMPASSSVRASTCCLCVTPVISHAGHVHSRDPGRGRYNGGDGSDIGAVAMVMLVL